MNDETGETRIYQDKYITDLQDAATAYSVTEYRGDKDCNCYIELDEAIKICKNAVQQVNQKIDDMIGYRERWIASLEKPDGDSKVITLHTEIDVLKRLKNKIDKQEE